MIAVLPERKEALKTLENFDNSEQDDIEKMKASDNLRSERIRTELELQEHREIIKMRRRWSYWILGCIIAIVIVDLIIILLLGFRIMKFDSNYAIPAFIADSIIKTIGLAYIIVAFLFNKDSMANSKNSHKEQSS